MIEADGEAIRQVTVGLGRSSSGRTYGGPCPCLSLPGPGIADRTARTTSNWPDCAGSSPRWEFGAKLALAIQRCATASVSNVARLRAKSAVLALNEIRSILGSVNFVDRRRQASAQECLRRNAHDYVRGNPEIHPEQKSSPPQRNRKDPHFRRAGGGETIRSPCIRQTGAISFGMTLAITILRIRIIFLDLTDPWGPEVTRAASNRNNIAAAVGIRRQEHKLIGCNSMKPMTCVTCAGPGPCLQSVQRF